MKNIVLLFCISLLVYSCSKNADAAGDSKGANMETTSMDTSPDISFENGQVIDNSTYFVKFPGAWKQARSGQAQTEFLLEAPIISNGDISREAVHLMKRDLAGKSLAEFIAMTMNQYQKEIVDFEILKADNNEFTFLGGPLENKAKYRHRFYEKEGKVYILGYSAGLKDWSTYEETAGQIMQTFRLK